MASFEDYSTDSTRNNRIVQRALREIDTRGLFAPRWIGLSPELQSIFFRNMSDRVQTMCQGDIQARAETGQESIDGARSLLLRLLDQASAEVPDPLAEAVPLPPPDIQIDTPEAVVSTFHDLAVFARSQSLLACKGLEDKIDDPLMRKGIRLLIDGWEPLLMRSMLENQKAAILRDLETRYDMILDGIDALCGGNTPEGIEEKLRSYIAHS